MTDLEKHIERALQAEAANYEPLADLVERTLQAAQTLPEPGFGEKLQARRVARWTSERSAGYPRWAYAGAAAVLLVAFYALGRTTTRENVFEGPVTQTSATVDGGVPTRRAAVADRDEAALATGGAATGMVAPGAPAPDVALSPVVPPGQPNPGVPPKIVRTVDLGVKVPDGRFESAWNRANQIATNYGGYVTQSSTEANNGGVAGGHLTMRVPADRLDAAVRDLRALGRVDRFMASGSDVAGQLVDYEARLRSLQAQEAQLLELLKQARSVGDILEVRTRLDQARTEIEQIQSQRQYLQSQVDLATVSVSLYERGANIELPRPVPRLTQAWQRGLEAATTVVAGVVVTLGYLAPLAILAALAWLGVRMARRRRA